MKMRKRGEFGLEKTAHAASARLCEQRLKLRHVGCQFHGRGSLLLKEIRANQYDEIQMLRHVADTCESV